MKQSLSYYITIFVLKLKGLKKDFSKDPIDFEKIRKADVLHPPAKFLNKNNGSIFKILQSEITEVKRNKNSDSLLIFIHGGAFISGPSKIHWDTIQEITKQTNHTIWLCNYPKAPENKIEAISMNIDAIYNAALLKYQAKKIILIGDSVGGTLATALVQRLVINNIEPPNKIVLISPVMDASLTNPLIDNIDPLDPMLSKIGVLSAKKMCAGNISLENPMISPINGSFRNFPPTILFLAEHDITFPDQQLAVKKLIEEKVAIEIIQGKDMPHIWPLLPVMKEAKTALMEIIKQIK